MGSRSYEYLKVENDGGVATVTFNRPNVLNVVNCPMHTELSEVFGDLGRDPAVNVIVATGAGRAFMAGGDVDMLDVATSGVAAAAALMKEARDMVWHLIQLEKPLISAVNGEAIGMGCHIALLSDFIFASETARFSDGHSRAGIAAGDGGVLIWPLLVGMARAKQYLLTGDFVDAREAERIGLVTKVVPQAELMETALKTAHRLNRGPLQAMKWTKAAVNQWLRFFATLGYDYSAAQELISLQGAEAREGIKALKEKRRPQYPAQV